MPTRAASPPGFRFSPLDGVVLVISAAAAATVWPIVWWVGLVILFVVLHFFLFCNVFRIARSLELAWAAVFVSLAAGTILFNLPGWPLTIALSLAVTAIVITAEMRKATYHGIFWRRVNPSLLETRGTREGH